MTYNHQLSTLHCKCILHDSYYSIFSLCTCSIILLHYQITNNMESNPSESIDVPLPSIDTMTSDLPEAEINQSTPEILVTSPDDVSLTPASDPVPVPVPVPSTPTSSTDSDLAVSTPPSKRARQALFSTPSPQKSPMKSNGIGKFSLCNFYIIFSDPNIPPCITQSRKQNGKLFQVLKYFEISLCKICSAQKQFRAGKIHFYLKIQIFTVEIFQTCPY